MFNLESKIIAAAAVFALGLIVGWRVASWHYQAHEASAVKAAAAADRANLLGIIKTQQVHLQAATEASNGYQAEAARLRTANALIPVVRMRDCPKVAASGPGATGPTAGRPDATGPAGGVVPPADAGDPGVSRDIGPDLMALMAEADRTSAQLRALQDFVRRTAQ